MSLKESPALKILLAILLTVIVLYGFNRYAYDPNRQKIQQKRTELKRMTTTLLHVRETVENLPRVKAEYETLQDEWQRLQTLVPETEEVTEIIEQISRAERKAGIYIISIEPQVPRARELYTVNPYRLQIEGSFHSFARFLSILSALPRIINVSDIVLSSNPSSTDESDAVVVRCLLTSYTSLRRSG